MTTATAPQARFLTRHPRETDRAFVYNSFLKSFRESDQSSGIPNTEFYATFTAEWDDVLAAFSVLVAHPEEDEDEIAGWIAYHGPSQTVAWLYTKRDPWRRFGVARLLWKEAGLGRNVRALFGSSWALGLARSKGVDVRMCIYAEGARLLGGLG